jgi:hypothetical protein
MHGGPKEKVKKPEFGSFPGNLEPWRVAAAAWVLSSPPSKGTAGETGFVFSFHSFVIVSLWLILT